MGKREEFERKRERLNALVLWDANLPIQRFFALDSQVYEDRALPRKTKELLGLVASLVRRCDHCVSYHLIQAKDQGVRKEEVVETLSVALVVGRVHRHSSPAALLCPPFRALGVRDGGGSV